jgi:hypothetical protein
MMLNYMQITAQLPRLFHLDARGMADIHHRSHEAYMRLSRSLYRFIFLVLRSDSIRLRAFFSDGFS